LSRLKIHILVSIVFCWAKVLQSQTNEKYYTEKRLITYADGLPARAVTQAIQDNNGFMWFVTQNGLCRFDGKVFDILTQKSHGLYSNHINYIACDNNNAIIVSYFNDINKFTYQQNHFEVIDINTFKVKKLNEHYKNIPFLHSDISLIRMTENKNIVFYLKPFYLFSPESIMKSNFWELDNKGVFLKKDLKIIKTIQINDDKEKPEAIIEPFKDSPTLINKNLYVVNDGTVCENYKNLGATCFRVAHEDYFFQFNCSGKRHVFNLKNYATITEVDSTNTSCPKFLFENGIAYINKFMSTHDVVYTKNKNVYVYNSKKEIIPIIDSSDNETVKKASINGVFKDKIGNYWFSTSEGILKAEIKNKKFHTEFSLNQIPFGLNNSARKIFEFHNSMYFALHDFIAIKSGNQRSIIKNDYNFSFVNINGNLWLGTENLCLIDEVNKKIKSKYFLFLREIWDMYALNTNQLLIAATEGIGIYDFKNEKLQVVDSGNFARPGLCYKIIKHNQNSYVVANNGIYILNNNGKIIDCYSNRQKDKNKKLEVNEINDVYIDKEGLFWIASGTDGLFCWDKNKGMLQQFGVENGFISLTHYRIEEDQHHNLWISTEFGLAKFNRQTKRAKIFTKKDGVADNEFNRSSSFKDKNGNLYFGGINGITYFNPNDFFIEEATVDFPLVVKSVNVYNSETGLTENNTNLFYNTKQIELNDKTKNATVDVVLLDLENRIHNYAYQINGLSNEWNYIKEGSIELNNLPYGNYNLIIKAQCLNGAWNKTMLSIPISIPVPFYKTWWFVCALFLIGIVVIFLYVTQKTKNIKAQKQKLEQAVEVRTEELKTALAQQNALLQEVHHRVKNNLQFIAAMLKMQINSIKDESNQTVLKETSRRINAMSLIHEMLYNKEKFEYVSVKIYLSELASKLNEMVKKTNTPLNIKLNIDDVNFNINNCVAIGMITSEIISNAIKYAFAETQNPTLIITLNYDGLKNCIVYTIQDNGAGLHHKNTGLGMRLIDIFARQMEAEYKAINNKGLTYLFTIPYTINDK
jgi:two-component sensor histidine kinase/ligand-binding sensor domain-containing protein